MADPVHQPELPDRLEVSPRDRRDPRTTPAQGATDPPGTGDPGLPVIAVEPTNFDEPAVAAELFDEPSRQLFVT